MAPTLLVWSTSIIFWWGCWNESAIRSRSSPGRKIVATPPQINYSLNNGRIKSLTPSSSRAFCIQPFWSFV
ncbi:hypothetical protein CEXT_78971 [Caerostris extrusa]|uniref:Secreted protein n=1 Tax=Caerostris extrusa TaxID=172846 RepID=A0AAV4PQQ7_CAEEX|nr:hypothetical protein CEXT_78971 [Caerostris extrusa]